MIDPPHTSLRQWKIGWNNNKTSTKLQLSVWIVVYSVSLENVCRADSIVGDGYLYGRRGVLWSIYVDYLKQNVHQLHFNLENCTIIYNCCLIMKITDFKMGYHCAEVILTMFQFWWFVIYKHLLWLLLIVYTMIYLSSVIDRYMLVRCAAELHVIMVNAILYYPDNLLHYHVYWSAPGDMVSVISKL